MANNLNRGVELKRVNNLAVLVLNFQPLIQVDLPGQNIVENQAPNFVQGDLRYLACIIDASSLGIDEPRVMVSQVKIVEGHVKLPKFRAHWSARLRAKLMLVTVYQT